MNKEVAIIGEMGKGGKGKVHTPVEYSDTLRSTQTIRVLLAVSEGEIDSIEDVYLNRVSISNFNATYEVRTGTLNQQTIPGFIDTEAPLPAFTTSQITTTTQGGPYSIDTLAGAAKLTLFTPALKQYLGNGDLVGTTVSLSIWTSPDGIIWTFYKTTTKTGKASSQYAWDVLVTKPNDAIPDTNWYVRVTRDTPDSSSDRLANASHIASVIQVYYKNLTYPGTALVAITMYDADQFGGQIPEISIKGKFLKVKIPNNYNPITREYTGLWDLGMNPVRQYTNNLAWVIYYCLTSSQALGIPEIEIDKAAFYEFSQYCDQMVSDGKGDYIPRYTIGYQFYTRDNVPSFMANLLALGNANLSVNPFGQITIIYDHPNVQVSKLVTNANVVDGIFNYTSSDLEHRTTVVNVTYNNIDSYGDTDTATIPGSVPTEFEQGLMDRYGIQVSDIVLQGCTHTAQALRKARWALYTNCKNTRFISFRVLLQGLVFYSGEIIGVMDSENQLVMQHAVITDTIYTDQGGGNILIEVTLDRNIELSNNTWSLFCTSSDGVTTYEETIIESNTTTNTLSFIGTTAHSIYIGSACILSGPVEMQLYKVSSIKKEDDYYVIGAIEHKEEKYTYIDEGIVLDTPTGDFINVSQFTSEAVTNLTVVPVSSSTSNISNVQLHVSWDWDVNNSERYKASFIAAWRRDDQDLITLTDIQGNSFDINNAVPGTYEIYVWAVNSATNIKSNSTFIVYNYRVSAGGSTLLPPINARITGTSGLVYSTASMSLSFDYNPTNFDIFEDSLLDYIVELWDYSGVTKYSTHVITPDVDKNGIFILPFLDNLSIFGTPTRQYQIKLFSRDLTGFLSTASTIVVNNPVPSVPAGLNVVAGIGVAYLRITPGSDLDIAGYRVHSGDTALFTPDNGNEVYNGPDTSISLPIASGETIYFKVAAYDSFGTTGLNYSSAISTTALSVETDTWTFTGLIFEPNNPTTNSIHWTSGTAYKNGLTSYGITSGSAAWTTGTLYIYYHEGDSTLSASTSLIDGIGTGSQIIATYTGGTEVIVGNGNAFISGNKILANTVGANQLVTSTAIITTAAQLAAAIIQEAHIQDASISNAKIKDFIQSSNFSDTNHFGWKLDKNGNFTSYGALKLGTPGAATNGTTQEFRPKLITWNGNAGYNGNIVYKSSGSAAWDTQAYSTESYTGGCAVRFSAAQTNKLILFGLNTDPATNASYETVDYCFVLTSSGVLYTYESGTYSGYTGTYTTEDLFEIEYNNTNILYKKNGTIVRTVAVGSGLTFYVDSSLNDIGGVIDGIQFGQYTTVTQFYGARMEINSDVIKVYDRNNILRVKLGNLNA